MVFNPEDNVTGGCDVGSHLGLLGRFAGLPSEFVSRYHSALALDARDSITSKACRGRFFQIFFQIPASSFNTASVSLKSASNASGA